MRPLANALNPRTLLFSCRTGALARYRPDFRGRSDGPDPVGYVRLARTRVPGVRIPGVHNGWCLAVFGACSAYQYASPVVDLPVMRMWCAEQATSGHGCRGRRVCECLPSRVTGWCGGNAYVCGASALQRGCGRWCVCVRGATRFMGRCGG